MEVKPNMKKKDLVTLVMSVVGGILFALGMCMGLVPEWNAMNDGIIIGVIGLVVLLSMVIIRRKMDGKPAIVLNGKVIGTTLLATALVSPFAGRLYDKVGIRKIFIPGSICLVISNLGMSLINMDTPLAVAAAWNVIRNVSIGALMMPLLTWGTGSVREEKVADASSLLTSFRTISGSIGSAVFVGIMTLVGSSSTLMHGLNMAFAAMALSALALAVLAIWGTRKSDSLYQ
jgi:MFS family permease